MRGGCLEGVAGADACSNCVRHRRCVHELFAGGRSLPAQCSSISLVKHWRRLESFTPRPSSACLAVAPPPTRPPMFDSPPIRPPQPLPRASKEPQANQFPSDCRSIDVPQQHSHPIRMLTCELLVLFTRQRQWLRGERADGKRGAITEGRNARVTAIAASFSSWRVRRAPHYAASCAIRAQSWCAPSAPPAVRRPPVLVAASLRHRVSG